MLLRHKFFPTKKSPTSYGGGFFVLEKLIFFG